MPTAPIRATLKFLANTDEPLVYIPSRGGGDETDHIGNFATHEVNILDGRRLPSSTSLDVEGFRLVPQHTTVENFHDQHQIESAYHAEIKQLLTEIAGATEVEIFDDTRRTSSLKQQHEKNIREPAAIVHNDYTARSGVRRLQDYFAESPEAAERWQRERFAIINVWRSMAGPVLKHPLAICDATTVRGQDLVSVERRAPERSGELQVALHHPAQRWYYFPAMQMEEALVFKTFDTATDGRARFTIHSSFDDPSAPPDAPPRQSIETRCLVAF